MRLMRNTTADRKCKYALIRNDKIAKLHDKGRVAVENALVVLGFYGVLEDPAIGDPEEFFVIKLKDCNAAETLMTYSREAYRHDKELSADVEVLATRAELRTDSKWPD